MKKLIILALLALSMQAETVYLTAKGKTYHNAETCSALARSKHILTADDAEAKAHGLHQCGVCYRTKKAGGAAGNSGWAKAAAIPVRK